MCRLVAYAGAPMKLTPLVFGGSHSLYRQSWEPRELLSGSVNADGWGVSWYDPDPGEDAKEGVVPEPRRLAEPRPVWREEGLRTLLDGLRSGLALAALRNATPGIPADRSGLLPMVLDRWSFVLNGYVPDFRTRHMRALRRDLPDALYARLAGSSDSETLFLLAVSEVERGASLLEGLRATAARVRARVGAEEAQLTMALSDGAETALLRTSTVARTNSLWVARGHALAPRGVVVASERLDDDAAWDALPTHAALRMDTRGRVDIEALEHGPES